MVESVLKLKQGKSPLTPLFQRGGREVVPFFQKGGREWGFTLLELAVVLVVLSILASAGIPNIVEKYNENRAQITLNEIQTLTEAARLWAYRNEGRWPDEGNQCRDAFSVLSKEDYIRGFDEVSPWGTRYVTHCDFLEPSNQVPLFMVTTKSDPKWVGYIANNLPTTTLADVSVGGDVTHTYTTLPGAVPAIKTVLHRNKMEGHPYLNQMNTTMDMNGHDILSAKDIETIHLNASNEVKTKMVIGSVRAGNLVASPIYIDANSEDKNNPYFFDPSGVSVLDGQQGGTRSHSREAFALTVLDSSALYNQANKNPEGSLNVNDIVFRSRPDFADPNKPGWASDVGIRCYLQEAGDAWSQCNGVVFLGQFKFKVLGKKYKIPHTPTEGERYEVPYFCEGGTPIETDPGRITDMRSQRCKACGKITIEGKTTNCKDFPGWW